MTDRQKLLATLKELGVPYTEMNSKAPVRASVDEYAGSLTKVVSIGQGHLHFLKPSEDFVGVEWDDMGTWEPRKK